MQTVDLCKVDLNSPRMNSLPSSNGEAWQQPDPDDIEVDPESTSPNDGQPECLPQWGDAPPDPPAPDTLRESDNVKAQSAYGEQANRPDPFDAIVRGRLQELARGLSQEELDSWVTTRYLDFLSEDLSVAALTLYLGWLVERVKAQGYKPQTIKQYERTWRQIAKAKVANKQAQKKADAVEQQAAGHRPWRFIVKAQTLPGATSPDFTDPATGQRRSDAPPLQAFQTEGIFDSEDDEFLTNFTLVIDEETTIHDDQEQRKVFRGKLTIFGKAHPFEIAAGDYADNNKLKAAIMQAAGVGAVISGRMDMVRTAISTLNWQPGKQQPLCRAVTTDLGWDEKGTAYRVPSGRVTTDGFILADQQDMQVELGGEELAKHLDLQPLKDDKELQRVRKHIVDDLLQIHGSRVTHSLLASVAVAVMGRFAADAPPFVLWLQGLTGGGKSFAAKLFMNFFGKFPLSSGHFAGWAATANYLQRQGYFFKDALYLVDDYKPEVVPHYQVVRLLQNYADGTGRGRLKSDSTTNTSRPVRGLLVSTGEDVPEHTASALARMIIIKVPQQAKDLKRGNRCQKECGLYSGVTADFIQHVLANNRAPVFAKRVQTLREFYYNGIAGQQNDSRIATNFALLAAGFFEVAIYLADVWPQWKEAIRQFVMEDLVALRDEMVVSVQEEQPSQVFWSVLGSLVEYGIVELDDRNTKNGKPVIGKACYPRRDGIVAGRTDELFYVSTDLALAEVNKSLRAQGKPELKVTTATLLGQLRRDGRLLDEDGQVLGPEDDDTTKQVRIAGKAKRTFITSKAMLTSSGPSGAPRTRPGASERVLWPSATGDARRAAA